jgi:hypothetical protein
MNCPAGIISLASFSGPDKMATRKRGDQKKGRPDKMATRKRGDQKKGRPEKGATSKRGDQKKGPHGGGPFLFVSDVIGVRSAAVQSPG